MDEPAELARLRRQKEYRAIFERTYAIVLRCLTERDIHDAGLTQKLVDCFLENHALETDTLRRALQAQARTIAEQAEEIADLTSRYDDNLER